MRRIVEEICRRKRESSIEPAVATELEVKRELERRGVVNSFAEWMEMRRVLEADSEIVVRRCLMYSSYEYYGDNAEAKA